MLTLSSIFSLFKPVYNCEKTAIYVCDILNVPVSKTSLINALLEHPDYPSLLSISDVLQTYGIANVSLRVKSETLTDLPTPFVAQVIGKKTNTALFALIYNISSENVKWRNPETHKVEMIKISEFKKLFTNYMQLYEASESAGEKNYLVNAKKEKTSDVINSILAFSIPVLTLIVSIFALLINGISAIFPALYTIVTLLGVISGALLVLYEIDQYNPTLQKVCKSSKKYNCAAILHSKGAKIFGIHWSAIGFSYFMGVLAVLLGGGIYNSQLLNVAAWINCFVLPYTGYSIYYQARIIKQWCPMCLTVQVVLLFLFITSLFGGFFSVKSFQAVYILPYIISIGIVFLAVYLLLPALEKSKAAKHYLHNLQRLKHNSQIFGALLTKQKQIKESTDGLGLILVLC